MAAQTTFRLPDIGEGVHEGEIVQWLVKVGEWVEEDQPLLEVMTDKVTAEIPSPQAGRVKSLCGKPGDVIGVGAVIVEYDNADTASPDSVVVPEPATMNRVASASAALVINDAVTRPPLATPATRKLARSLGIDLNTIRGSGSGGRICTEDVYQAANALSGPPVLTREEGVPELPESLVKPAHHAHDDLPSPTEPVAPQPKPSRFEVELPAAGLFVPPVVSPISETVALPASSSASNYHRQPFRGIRRKIADHLAHAKQVAPHFGYVDEVDFTEVVRLREQLLPTAKAEDVRLNYLPFIIQAVIRGLKAFPILNSSLDAATQELIFHHDFNIGIAVSTDDGLLVPVLHRADILSLKQLAQQIQQLAQKARAGMLARDEVTGGTFTITSIGSIGGLFGLPIVNVPEVGILGVNQLQRRPVVRTVNGEESVVIRDMMYLSMSCDHRIVDGAVAAQFINHVIRVLQTPSLLLYE